MGMAAGIQIHHIKDEINRESPQMETASSPKDLLGDAMGQRDLPVAISMMRTIKAGIMIMKLSES